MAQGDPFIMEDNEAAMPQHEDQPPLGEGEVSFIIIAGATDADGFLSAPALWNDVVRRRVVGRVHVSVARHRLTAVGAGSPVKRRNRLWHYHLLNLRDTLPQL